PARRDTSVGQGRRAPGVQSRLRQVARAGQQPRRRLRTGRRGPGVGVGGVKQGTIEAGVQETETAAAWFASSGDVAGRAEAEHQLGALYKAMGRQGDSASAYRLAIELFEIEDDAHGIGKASHGLANTLRNMGQMAEARVMLDRARENLGRAGNRAGVAWCANGLGELARVEEDFDTAERCYHDAQATLTRLGSSDAIIPGINLALT